MIPKAPLSPPLPPPLLSLVYMYMEKIKTKIKSMSPSGEVRRHFFGTHASKIGLAFPSRRQGMPQIIRLCAPAAEDVTGTCPINQVKKVLSCRVRK